MMNGEMGSWYFGMGSGNWMFGVLMLAVVIVVVAAAVKYLSKSK